MHKVFFTVFCLLNLHYGSVAAASQEGYVEIPGDWQEIFYALIPNEPESQLVYKYIEAFKLYADWTMFPNGFSVAEKKFIKALQENRALVLEFAARALKEDLPEKAALFEALWDFLKPSSRCCIM